MTQRVEQGQGPRVSEEAPPEASLRAILAGCFLGGAVAAMNIYFGLRTGWGIGGSLIAAILGYALFAALRPAREFTLLEANLTQTAGSAAGSMTSAAGLLSAVPALGMLGRKLGMLELGAWALAVAYLGVFFAVPLRRQMVLVEKLRFPTGTATAETLQAIFSSGEEAIRKSRVLIRWGIGAALFTIAAFFIPQLGSPPMEWIGLGLLGAWGFSLLISPLMTGAGILIGPNVAASLLAGALLGWGLLGPYVQAQGWAPGGVMKYSDGPRGWILWPGVAIMVADALTSLALSWRTIVQTFRPVRSGDAVIEDSAEAIPNAWWIGGLIVASLATIIVARHIFEIPAHFTLLAIMLSAVLSMIAVRSTGETDINPIGGVGKVTQLVFGALAPGAMTTNLMSAAITGAGASQAADMMQDLKTGHLLGASPKAQFKGQLFGILAGVLFCVPIYALFDAAYEIGSDELPAPAAHAWKAMAELLSKGLDALPPHALHAVLAGAFLGILFPLLKKIPSLAPYVPSGMAFGIAFIVPPFYSIAMFLGAMLFLIWKKRAPEQALDLAFPVASGLIAGEGLMGIVTAILTLLGFGALT